MKNVKKNSRKPSTVKGKRGKNNSTKKVSTGTKQKRLPNSNATHRREVERIRTSFAKQLLRSKSVQQKLSITGGGYQISIFDIIDSKPK
ncbi:MAG: hypothetical protein ABI855_05295 [Bacteroidota bacterium]